MARLTALSGLGRKSAAVFLLEIEGRRLLLDLGTGLERGEHPDLSGAGRIDAVLMSHAHVDHCGALDRLNEIGDPPVYATAEALSHLPAHLIPARTGLLPERGISDVFGLRLGTGRAGHAPGGVWMHLPSDQGGLLYTGDFSMEARELRFDPCPLAATLLADASYGDRDSLLSEQIADLAEAAGNGAVLPCPAAGRGPDMALALREQGLEVYACQQIAAETFHLTGQSLPVTQVDCAHPGQIIVAAGSNAESGLPAQLAARTGFRFIFSGHVPHTSPARAMIGSGRALWLGWNVHPRRSDFLALADHCGARRVIPAFLDLDEAPHLTEALGPRLVRNTPLEV
ncbi:MAG: MBL fold metallo-hydrolase [Confluentimicrobium sp.]|jgi:hypothetical protein|uniref:MBL fold metallo-hydrolase n=1 Tax=Actibacterium sp. TaxID=1872125 RepID=UPI000C377FF2|nr:MBL fold metallo-hydrolase [Actibacterium sp.]MBC56741.1 MBL fold metallo-hydrolase [Actibacterium sp.]|tara:strand:+ start:3100 stop:4125 length:1026 start_codon:yes stop_codon:yes gene_type:complete